jgi:predicted ester cyclase
MAFGPEEREVIEVDRSEIERVDDETLGAWSAQDLEGLLKHFANDAVWNDAGLAEPLRGTGAIRAYVQGWFTAFPDIALTRTNRVIDGQQVAVELEFRGTNTGPMILGVAEVPPTGRAVTGRGAYFARVRQGKVVEFSSHPDRAGMMMQLGLIPGP